MNTELTLSWIIGAVIILIFLIPYLWGMKKKEEKTRARQIQAKETGADKPLMQHPIINQSLCIGCGICVASCPEGDVLGLINGKSTIINGSHCVGHALCAENCPISAIEVGLGDISHREDIPQLTENFETNVPNIFIIGELSGLALIRNAISHGVRVIDHIQQRHEQRTDGILDVLIIGAGPAGLSAALRGKELGLNCLVIDQYEPGGTILQYPRKKITLVQRVSLPLWGELKKLEYAKEELLEIWKNVISTQNLKLYTMEKLLTVTPQNGHHLIKTTQNQHKAKHVILALGRRGTPRKLGVPGESLGKVMYKLIDAETYQNNRILIVGGGDSAIEAAVGLVNQKGNEVTLSYRKKAFFRLKAKNEERIQSLINDGKINAFFNSNVKEIREQEVIIDCEGDSMSIPNDFVFVFIGGEMPFPILNQMGIQFGKKVEAVA